MTRCLVSIVALAAAFPALAQTTELEPIKVIKGAEQAFFGDVVALETGEITRTGDGIADTPRSVFVASEQQIAERGAQNVEQVLQYSAGIVAGQWGLDNRSDWSLIRGFSPTTLHNGLPSRYGFYNDTKPEPFMLSSVQALRGPASGLFGAGSVGGVVNTTSKTSAQDSDNLVQLQLGSHSRRQIGVDFSGDLNADGSLRYRVVGMKRAASTIMDHTRDDAIALAPSLTWEPTPDTKLTVLLNYQKTDTSPLISFAPIIGTLLPARRFLPFLSSDFINESTFVGEPGFDKFDAEQRAISAQLTHTFENGLEVAANMRRLSSKAVYQHAWWANDNIATFRYAPNGTINRTVYRADGKQDSFAADVSATAHYTLGSADMRSVFGAAFTTGDYDTDAGLGRQVGPINPFNPSYTGVIAPTVFDTGTSEVDEVKAFVQNRATIGDRLIVDFGLQFSKIKSTIYNANNPRITTPAKADDRAWTKNAAVMYKFDNGISPYISYAESFEQEDIGTDASGNAFDPTRGQQIEAGLKYQPAGGDTLVSASVFGLKKSNIRVTDPSNPNFKVQQGEATVRGLELQAFQRFGDFTFDLAYTRTRTKAADGGAIAAVPENGASLWMAYAPTAGKMKGWRFGAGVRHVGQSDANVPASVASLLPAKTPAYTLYDAAVSYDHDDWQVALNVRNLADKRHVTLCSQGSCYFGDRRNIALTFTTKF